MRTKVSLKSASGEAFDGELALPEGSGKGPAVLLFHEWWGINDHVRSLLDRLAADGFVAFTIDLFDGKTTKDADEAGKMMGSLDFAKAIDRAKGAVAWLATHERSNGKVGATGFCLGGALSFAAACNIPELGAVVAFYGVPDPSKVDYKGVKAPIQGHFAARDQWAKPELAEAIKKDLESQGKTMELHVYDADHAFVNDTRPEVYSPENAKLAWSRMVAFLREKLK